MKTTPYQADSAKHIARAYAQRTQTHEQLTTYGSPIYAGAHSDEFGSALIARFTLQPPTIDDLEATGAVRRFLGLPGSDGRDGLIDHAHNDALAHVAYHLGHGVLALEFIARMTPAGEQRALANAAVAEFQHRADRAVRTMMADPFSTKVLASEVVREAVNKLDAVRTSLFLVVDKLQREGMREWVGMEPPAKVVSMRRAPSRVEVLKN